MFMVSEFIPHCDTELIIIARQYSEQMLIGKTAQRKYAY